jgi:hypothetical protein
MPIIAKDRDTVLASEAMSTKAAADVLASQTRAFGNASAKLSLQIATDKFQRAKETFLQRAAADESMAQEEK